MTEVMKSWLLKRLGIIIDLTPDIFGNYTCDGTLLAQLLHSYGIINSCQLGTIVKTQDPSICRVNLRYLRIWLHFIGVTCCDQWIKEISVGKGTAALQLFHKIYLSLEDKDRLDFITQEKEREKFVPTSRKFDVTTVPEVDLSSRLSFREDRRETRQYYLNNSDSVDWYRSWFRFQEESFQLDRPATKIRIKSKNRIDDAAAAAAAAFDNDADADDDDDDDDDDDARKPKWQTKKRGGGLRWSLNKESRSSGVSTASETHENCNLESIEENSRPTEISAFRIAHDALYSRAGAKNLLESLNDRSQNLAKSQETQLRLQKVFLSKVKENLEREQDEKIDMVLARCTLDQSQFEKRMITRLIEIRDERSIIAKNRKIVSTIKAEIKEREMFLNEERSRERTTREVEEINLENNRAHELARRLENERLERIQENQRKMSLMIINDLIDTAVNAAECTTIDNRP